MAMIANNVEFFALMDGNTWIGHKPDNSHVIPDRYPQDVQLRENQLSKSLWYFDGTTTHVCLGTNQDSDLAPLDPYTELSPSIEIATDFYPISIMRRAGMLSGVELEISQRRDLATVLFRNVLRVS